MDASQLRMARAGLNIGVHELARRAGVEPNTVSNIANDRFTGAKGGRRAASIQKLRDYLDGVVIFVDAEPGEHGSGVILREGVLKEDGPVEDGERQLLEYWRGHPSEWTALSEEARAATLTAIFGSVPEEDPIISETVEG